ncbi:YqiA/YcfP family alpha/beta fold hydrolase [[Limnothrix rosea] IAM M-220]|uniref:YqiA/YcfP family alpha/beta fold hydrolase n=1 Tax=[Limnothrix rosea] IAM M-220 TaxID=454133 RepID=UPI000963D033|nr:YqiA/YcfP family alpha/beta fold hydrolase [[Limnothrix rosea] IAM M-220]OKH17754.1 hypothetical protein NIES208_07990 [[Limnothrix rosea] IAM M-220]
MTQTIYLHGFASSPQSRKAQYFLGRSPNLVLPDLNKPNFGELTVSRQIDQVRKLLTEPSYIIGSSLGGLTAAVLAEEYPNLVKKIVLLAPAFQFTKNWRDRLGKDVLERWQSEGTLPIYHYSYKEEIPLHYEFFQDAETFCDYHFTNQIPTLILHGTNDETVPLRVSEAYAAGKAWVELIALDSDHSLGDRLPELYERTQTFLFDA